MNTLIVFFIRVLETLFVVGAIGCVLAVIPITAQRLLMVLFEGTGPDEEQRTQVSAPDSHQAA